MASFGDDCIFTSSDGTKSTPSPPNSHSKSSSKSSKNTNNSSLGNSEIADAILTHNGQIDKDIKEHDTDVQSHSESPSTKFGHYRFSEFESSVSTPTLSRHTSISHVSTTTDHNISSHSSAGTRTPIALTPKISLNYQVSATPDYNSLEIIDEKQNDCTEQCIEFPYLPDLPAQMSDILLCGHQENESQTYKIFAINEHSKGVHKWSIQILHFDVSRVEIGVVSEKNANSANLNSKGIKYSQNFGARAIYGMDLTDDSVYYASYNKDGSERCFKGLSKNAPRWKKSDVIDIVINYDKWKIKFYLNNEIVRKSLSLERDYKYYPIIAIFSKYGQSVLEWTEL